MRKKINTPFVSMEDFEEDDKQKLDDFLNAADMTPTPQIPKAEKKQYKKRGRKPKAQDDKAEIPKTAYFNEEQSKMVDVYCAKTQLAFSSLVRQLLFKEGIIK